MFWHVIDSTKSHKVDFLLLGTRRRNTQSTTGGGRRGNPRKKRAEPAASLDRGTHIFFGYCVCVVPPGWVGLGGCVSCDVDAILSLTWLRALVRSKDSGSHLSCDLSAPPIRFFPQLRHDLFCSLMCVLPVHGSQ